MFPPDSLIIMSDLRFCDPDYLDDQTWRLSRGTTSIRALVLETTFGMRANWMRFYPRFNLDNTWVCDPEDFFLEPLVQEIYPNFIKLEFSPFEGIETTVEYWVPTSQCIAGRFTFKNLGNQTRKMTFDWTGILNPVLEGTGLIPVKKEKYFILQGLTNNLSTVCFLTGGPQPGTGTFASLELFMHLEPNVPYSCGWANASQDNSNLAIDLAKGIINRNFDAEFNKIERKNFWQMVEINTGKAKWDNFFRISQKIAFSLFFPGSEHLPNPSFVLSRRPDQGYSYNGDGSDYSYSWNGQSLLDTYFLAGLIPANSKDLIKGIIDNFLSVQEDNGFIDAHPGLAGQRCKYLAQPLLAALAWKIYDHDGDIKWLERIFPGLIRFLQCWFSDRYDKDGDGLPEWQNLIQTGLENHPLLDHWLPESIGVNIEYIESPALLSFLLRECQSLIAIGQEINQEEEVSWISRQAVTLKNGLSEFWSQKDAAFLYRDYQNHTRSRGENLLEFSGSGSFSIRNKNQVPERLHLVIRNINESTRTIVSSISGEGSNGEEIVEKFSTRDVVWILGKATYTTKNLFSKIYNLDIIGLQQDDRGQLSTIDFTMEDISLYLPLWAHAIPEKNTRDRMVEKLKQTYFVEQGLSNYPDSQSINPRKSVEMSPIWNYLLLEGLLENDYRELAADILSKYLSSCEEAKMAPHLYHWGSNIQNLAPVDFFLKLIGIKKFTIKDIIIDGYSPFPYQITVKNEGVTIIVIGKEFQVVAPNGTSVSIIGPGPHRIELE